MSNMRGMLAGLLAQRGYSPVQAAGILGNLQVESALNPTAIGDNGTSYGLGQWHKDRWQGLKSHAAGLGLDPSDPSAQISFLDWELKNREGMAYQALQAAQTPEQAALAMMHYERPAGYTPDNPGAGMHADKRIANAVAAFGGLPAGMVGSGSATGQPQPAAGAAIGLLGGAPATGDQKDETGLLSSLLSGGSASAAQADDPAPSVPRRKAPTFSRANLKPLPTRGLA